MKKLILLLALFISISTLASAQITKADVQRMMKDVGTSVDKMEFLYVANFLVFYNDGKYKRTFKKYKKASGDYTLTIEVLDSGILLKTDKGSQAYSRTLYPYDNISNIFITAKGIDIFLKE